MEKKKKKKITKKDTNGKKKKKNPLNVFDIDKKDLVGKDGKPISREERIRRDKIKLAKRYEAIKLFDESIKYYKQLGMEDEVKRVSVKKTQLYQAKAHEFEEGGRYAEAAELYDRLNMLDKAQKLRDKAGVKQPQTFDFDDKSEFEDLDSDTRGPQSTKSLRWEMPNVEMDTVGQEELEVESVDEDTPLASKPAESADRDVDEQMVASVSPNIEWKPEDEGIKTKSSDKDSQNKAFSICPYCGEELNLPKQPKFCPFCREPFS